MNIIYFTTIYLYYFFTAQNSKEIKIILYLVKNQLFILDSVKGTAKFESAQKAAQELHKKDITAHLIFSLETTKQPFIFAA